MATQAIEDAITQYRVLLRATDSAQRHAESKFDYFDGLVPELAKEIRNSKKADERKQIVKRYFDGIRETIENDTLIALVATFEGEVFSKLSRVIGEARNLVEHADGPNAPQTKLRRALIKDDDDIYNSGSVKNLLKSQLSETSLLEDLENLLHYRHHLAHGRRFSKHKRAVRCIEAFEILQQVNNVVMAAVAK